MHLLPFPEEFENKGKYRRWDRHWDPTGYADKPAYPGQQPVRFPEDATPFESFAGGYLRKG